MEKSVEHYREHGFIQGAYGRNRRPCHAQNRPQHETNYFSSPSPASTSLLMYLFDRDSGAV